MYPENDFIGPPMAPLASTAVAARANSSGYTPTTVSDVSTAQATAQGTGQQGPGFWGQGGGAQMALGAIQTLGSLWNSFQQNKMAKQSLALQTRAFETNLRNQTQSYNTALEDRIRARYATEGRSEQADSYIAKNRL